MSHTEQAADLGISSRIRRSQGRLARNAIASVKVTKDEQKELEAAAKHEGKALSEWAREVLLEKARTGPTGTATFTELVALRMLTSTVLRTLALGETVTAEAYAQILAEVKTSKHEIAKDVLTQYQNQGSGK